MPTSAPSTSTVTGDGVTAGTFQMGSPAGEQDRVDAERQLRVTITRDVWMQAHEVTQGEWEALMGNNPSYFSSCGSDCPVEMVTWEGAIGYANALSRSEGLEECYVFVERAGGLGVVVRRGELSGLGCQGYRLPTDAEWEYAARAGTTTAWSCGSSELCLGDVAWYGANSGGATHPVGEKWANPWGLYDMHGNVQEWTGDWKGDYPTAAVTDPLGPATGTRRVCRGGHWGSFAGGLRSADRNGRGPGAFNADVGFRLARSVR